MGNKMKQNKNGKRRTDNFLINQPVSMYVAQKGPIAIPQVDIGFEEDAVKRARHVYNNYEQAKDSNIGTVSARIRKALRYMKDNVWDAIPAGVSNCTLSATQWVDPTNPIGSAKSLVVNPEMYGYNKIKENEAVPGNLVIAKVPNQDSFHTMMITGFTDKDGEYDFNGKKFQYKKGEPLVTYSRGGSNDSFLRQNVPLSVYTANSDGHTLNQYYRYNYPNEVFLPEVTVGKALGGILSKNSDSTILADNNNYIQDFKGKQYGLPTVRYANGGHLFGDGDAVETIPQNYTGYTVNPMYWGNMKTTEGQPITNILGYLGNSQARVQYDDGTIGTVEYPQNFVQGIAPEVTVYGKNKSHSNIINYTRPREGEEQPWYHSPNIPEKSNWDTPQDIARKHGLLLPANILDYDRMEKDEKEGVLPQMSDEEMLKAYNEAKDWAYDYYYSPGFQERFHKIPELSKNRRNINQGLNSFEYNMGNNDLDPFKPYHLKATKYSLNSYPIIREPGYSIANYQDWYYPYTSEIAVSTPHIGITNYDDLVYALTHELGHGIDNAIRLTGVQNGKEFPIGYRANPVDYSSTFPVFWNSKALNKVGLPSWYLYPRDAGLDAQAMDYPISTNGYDVHDGKPSESYADLIAFRKLAEDLGVFDSKKAGQEFTRDMLTQIKYKIMQDKNRSRSFRYRLLDNFSEDDIIWMMNNIAQNQKVSNSKDFLQDKPLYGKYGGHLFGNGGDDESYRIGRYAYNMHDVPGTTLPEVIVNGYAPIILDTYFPVASQEYPVTGHSMLAVPRNNLYSSNRTDSQISKLPQQVQENLNHFTGYDFIDKSSDSPTYNLLTNNCADATLGALNAIFGTNESPFLFTTPGDVLDYSKKIAKKFGGKSYTPEYGMVRTIIPRNKDNYRDTARNFYKYAQSHETDGFEEGGYRRYYEENPSVQEYNWDKLIHGYY